MQELQGRIAIVTGAASGLGKADARALIGAGAKVVLADIDQDRGKALAEELGPSASFAMLDVCDEGAWKAVVADAEGKFGGLDILVNSAGIAGITTPETVTVESYRRVMAISMEGTLLGCKYAIPAMRRRGGGSIVNMSSIAALMGEGTAPHYCAAKAAVESYTRSVAVYCAQMRLNINCNAVNPAMVDTPLVQVLPGEMQRHSADYPEIDYPPQAVFDNGKIAAGDVAAMIVYLCTDQARSINGQHIVIDNGATVTLGKVPALFG